MTDINHLDRKANQLKSAMVRKQMKNGIYSFEHSKKQMLKVLNEYKIHKSIFKAASLVGVDAKIAMKWYFEGMSETSPFRGFYLTIKEINKGTDGKISFEADGGNSEIHGNVLKEDYKISRYGDGWSYTTYKGGEKIFIISNGLDTLKEKVRSKHLPLD